MILFNFYMGWNSKFCFLEVVSPRTIECICHRLSTSAQRSQSLRVMKMLTPHGWMDGWMGGWMDGWMDGWMHRQTDIWPALWVILGEMTNQMQPTNQESVDTRCVMMTWKRFTFIDLNFTRHSNETSSRTVTQIPTSVKQHLSENT